MNSQNMTVLTNIIGAVESGGQVYGKRRYDAYAAPYTNSNIEYTVTLGWAQNYGDEARKLILVILDKMGETEFKKIDKDGSIFNMRFHDWVKERWNPTAAQKKTLIALIDSKAGHECQDELFARLMETFIAECESRYTKSIPAIMMYCEIRHLGGAGPVKRIFDRLGGDYSLDAIMASLVKDQKDTSSDNQVGDAKFWSRHIKCKTFIEQYAVPETADGTKTEAKKEETKVKYSRQKVVDTANSWIGKKESDGSYKIIIDTYNSLGAANLPRKTKMEYSWAWCACTWSAIAIKLGYTAIMPIEISCYYLIEAAKKMGCWKEKDNYVPDPADGVLYDWDDGTDYASTDNKNTPDHVGIVVSVDKKAGTFVVVEGNKSNAVGKRTMQINGRYIRGFICPKYDDNTVKQKTAASTPAANYIVGSGKVELKHFLVGAADPQIKAIQRILNAKGYKGKDGKKLSVDGNLGANTSYAIAKFQKAVGMNPDNPGTVATKTWEKLLNVD